MKILTNTENLANKQTGAGRYSFSNQMNRFERRVYKATASKLAKRLKKQGGSAK